MSNAFFGFSPESFEQFARTLALFVFGPGVTTFGNGPDGGREATFRGQVPYPYPPSDQWSGYGVIQAKCKEKAESTQRDQQWALKLLDDELKMFVESAQRNPKPEYYVFVTNVELSSKAGRDKADKIAQSYYRMLPLKGHAVWDSNQLSSFLAKYAELRQRFVAYLTPGDLLAAMLANIERERPNATRVLTAFLERELRTDEAARLDQAGKRTDEQLRLARLFFDLPAAPEPQLVPPEEAFDSAGNLPPGVLRELLDAGSRKLDPKTVYEHETATPEIKHRFPTRFVLLGGPGSGKSTVGQFLAQIHRAALLERRPPHLLEPETRQTIHDTRNLCEQEGLPWPATPRYPFRVDLSRFAKALASTESDQVRGLERYLLNALGREEELAHADLIQWLEVYPWLLILDGLDEVPPTSNRDDLVQATNGFLAQARQVGADLFVVATSRQQGYSGEFASGTPAFRHILPLSTPRALQYVARYASARFGATDPNRAEDIVSKLRESAKRELTAQLLTSPLQVTFMATVVAAQGDPGEDRWQLFASYYRTIYDRERQKAVPPYDSVLAKQQVVIDRLHHDIGFWLHYQGETTNSTAASLPIAQFERLVDAHLSELGREGSEKTEMVRLITEAARQRLVFLTSRVEGELSFEVRSLQECMAAECLMTGDTEVVSRRLRAIAPAVYWRNVFLFAASKCFADAQTRHMRDAVRLLCADLNASTDPLLAATKAGSELALDILQAGAVAENPTYARHLAGIAMPLLAQPYLTHGEPGEASAAQRLSLIYSDILSAAYQDEVKLRVGQARVENTLGAWPLLVDLVDKSVGWAADLAERRWPSAPASQVDIFAALGRNLVTSNWLKAKLEQGLQAFSFHDLTRIARSTEGRGVGGVLESLQTFLYPRHEPEIPLEFLPRRRSDSFTMSVTSMIRRDAEMEGLKTIAQVPWRDDSWLPLILANEFLSETTCATLAGILRKCARRGDPLPYPRLLVSLLPWPMAACLMSAKSRDDLAVLANSVDEGALGDITDWNAAEKRWTSKGITMKDMARRPPRPLPFESDIATVGWPGYSRSLSIASAKYPRSTFQALLSQAEESPPDAAQVDLLWLLLRASSDTGALLTYVKPSRLKALFEAHPSEALWFENVVAYTEKPALRATWLEFFEWLGRSDSLSSYYRPGVADERWQVAWQRTFIREPTRVGLLRLLGRVASSNERAVEIPAELLDLSAFVEPRFKLAALLVQLSQPGLSERDARRLAELAVSLIEPAAEAAADDLVFRTAERHLRRVPSISEFLLGLHQHLSVDGGWRVAKCERLLRRVLRTRASSCQAQDQLQKLQLPIMPAVESAY